LLASGIALALGGWSLTRLSPTIDEWGFVQSGVKFWFGGDSDWMIQSGTMPLMFWIQNAPGALYLWLRHGGIPGGLGGNFGLTLPLDDQLVVLHLARWTNLILTGLGTIWSTWWLTRRLFGRVAANVAALFCAIEPNLLAGYILGVADAAIVPPCILLMIVYEDYLKRPRTWKLPAAGGLFGLGMGLKISMAPTGLMVLWGCVLARLFEELLGPGPIAAKVRWALRDMVRFGLHSALFLALGFCVSWAANDFLWDNLLRPDSSNDVAYKLAGKLGYRGDSAAAWVGKLQRTMVPAPIGVLRSQVAHSRGGHPMMFRGVSGVAGPRYYYPYVFLMKTHLVMLLAVAASILRKGAWRSPVFLAALNVVVLSLLSKIHGGPRYFLVLYALGASLGGVGIEGMLGLLAGRRLRCALVAVLVAASLALTLRSTPQLLTHTSPFWGGDAEGYRYADANYDWGQGLYLAFSAADRRGLKPVAFLHSGDSEYGVPGHRTMIVGDDPRAMAEQMRGKFVVVSAHRLYHSEAEASEQVPLFLSLKEVGPDGRLTDTAFYFDFRSPGRFARLTKALDAALDARSPRDER
jgi:4-amino-4-deoxy-L-arabinose transferase-like glycosyltransferase